MNLYPCKRCQQMPNTTVEALYVYTYCGTISCLFFGQITLGATPKEAYVKWNGMQDNVLPFPVPGRGGPVPTPPPLPDPPIPTPVAR